MNELAPEMEKGINNTPQVAYFSMEVGLDSTIPTYSGGLGVLAGDTLRAAADLGIPMVGVSLLHRKGYFRQHLDRKGVQTESPVLWSPEDVLEPLGQTISVNIEGRTVGVRAWRYVIQGVLGHAVPVYLLDTALPENSAWDRSITNYLYGGDARYRLCQEAVLGIGGVAMLRALGHTDVETYHMNEGHSALLALALLEERWPTQHHGVPTEDELEAVRRRCVFTTHTPVPAGHDSFPLDLVERVLGEKRMQLIEQTGCSIDGSLNMTHLALMFSHYINGVSMRHEEISRDMFPDYPINSITNGVHAVTWTSPAFQRLYDRRIPEWRRDNLYLRYAMNIPADEIMHAHSEAKRGLLAEVQRCTGIRLDPSAMTLGFARRAAGYKRPDLLFTDRERLSRIASQCGPLQLVYAGKAHPKDEGGKAAIRRVFDAAASLADAVSFVYLEEYDMRLAQLLCSGVDLWLNTPMKPLEASGTSGMKAALNGVPSFSILDGWWLEGCVEGVTGWAIGEDRRRESVAADEVASLYNKLEFVILPMFYSRPAAFAEVMRSAIAVNASFFNAQRTMGQYLGNAYVMGARAIPSSP